jgi:hypothetical protein
MFISTTTQRRVNPYAPFVDADGTTYPRMPESLYTEIPDPPRGDDETQYTTEIDEPPYVVITDKSQEQLDQLHNSKIKAQIAQIEAGQARAVREAALGQPQYLQALEQQIQDLRAQLKPEPVQE